MTIKEILPFLIPKFDGHVGIRGNAVLCLILPHPVLVLLDLSGPVFIQDHDFLELLPSPVRLRKADRL